MNYAVIVTGDRHAMRHEWGVVIHDALATLPRWEQRIVIHGDQGYVDDRGNEHGIDRIAADIAYRIFHCGTLPMPAQWDTHGRKAAGPRRNRAMIQVALQLRDCGYDIRVFAFHDELAKSKGTKNTVEEARKAGLPVTVYGSDGQVKS